MFLYSTTGATVKKHREIIYRQYITRTSLFPKTNVITTLIIITFLTNNNWYKIAQIRRSWLYLQCCWCRDRWDTRLQWCRLDKQLGEKNKLNKYQKKKGGHRGKNRMGPRWRDDGGGVILLTTEWRQQRAAMAPSSPCRWTRTASLPQVTTAPHLCR
jgi:hypothetical protein